MRAGTDMEIKLRSKKELLQVRRRRRTVPRKRLSKIIISGKVIRWRRVLDDAFLTTPELERSFLCIFSIERVQIKQYIYIVFEDGYYHKTLRSV